MSLLRQFAGQTIIYGLGKILPRIFYFFVLTGYLTHRLKDETEFGLYGLMYSFATLFIVIMSYRMDTAFFRFGSAKGSLQKAYNTAFLPLVLTTIILVTIVILFSQQISSAVRLGEYPHYFRWFAIILGFDVLALLPFAKLRLQNKALIFSLFKIGNILVSAVLILYFLEFYHSEHGFSGWLKPIFPALNLEVDFVFIANIIASIILFTFLVLTTGRFQFQVDLKLWKKMVIYASPLIIVGVANSINQYFSVQLQQYFLPDDNTENIRQAGIYRAAIGLASLLVMFNTAFNYAAEPFFFKNAARENDKTIYAKVLKMYSVAASIAIIILIYFLDVFQLILGPNYRDGVFVIPLLLFAFLMLGIYYNVSIWYKLSDKTIFGSYISLVGVVVTLTVSIILLPEIGFIASAIASLLCYATMVLLAYYFGKKHYPIAYDLKHLFTLLTVLIFFLMGHYFLTKLDLGFAIYTIIRILLLALFVYWLFRTNRQLWNELLSSKA